MSQHMMPVEKAALLISSLEPEEARAMLRWLPAEEAESIERAVAQLQGVDDDARDDALRDFFKHHSPENDHDAISDSPSPPNRDAPNGERPGVELDADLARRLGLETYSEPAVAQPAPPEILPPENRAETKPPFEFLHEASASDLAGFLRGELPRTIAVVLSHMPAVQAAEVLGRLDQQAQVDVLQRLVDLDETDPEIIRDVERGLEARLARKLAPRPLVSSGSNLAGAILDAADTATERKLMANVFARDRVLAERLDGPAPSFSWLEQLDNAAWARILEVADNELIVLALAGASPKLYERIERGMAPSNASRLRHALEHFGPTRLSDVQEAQRAMVSVARGLHYRGLLHAAHADTSATNVYAA